MPQGYRAKVEGDNAAGRERSRNARDIADGFPGPGNLKRRNACARNFKRYCETYFPNAFRLRWSKDHLRVIDRIEDAVLNGGLFALAMPRGTGKTTLVERAALWAMGYRHRRFVALVGATESAAEAMLRHLKTELSLNDLLAEDFRSICYPIRQLENNARRCVGQLFNGEQTRIDWGAKRIVLPTMPDKASDGANASGGCVTVAGLTGALRGQSHVLASGEIIRPELILLDDPQTRDSAMSPTQSLDREEIIRGDVLGMAGPGNKVAALMPCTVIREGDLADRLLNRELNPAWQGERTQAVYAWPTADELWEQYLRVRAEGLRKGTGTAEATAFYRKNRKAMDAGAVVAWPQRHNPDELSAVQHNVNLRADLGESAYSAEYQNAPLKPEGDDVPTLTAAEVAGKLNGLKKEALPVAAAHLTAFIDVHDALLFWCVCAWAPDFTGWVVSYGTYPDQKRRQFTLRKATPTLADLLPGAGREGVIRAGLMALTGDLLGREWAREDGAGMKVGRCLVDAGYCPQVVYDVCRHSPHAAALLPSRGVGIGAVSRPMNEYTPRPGERHGFNWLIAKTPDRAGRHCRFDSNAFKTFVHGRLAGAVGDRASLSLYGRKPEEHRLFSEHLVAERPVRVSANGRTVDEWSMRPGTADNHWLDTAVGCAVAASIEGCALPDTPAAAKPKRVQTVSFKDMQAAAKARAGR